MIFAHGQSDIDIDSASSGTLASLAAEPLADELSHIVELAAQVLDAPMAFIAAGYGDHAELVVAHGGCEDKNHPALQLVTPESPLISIADTHHEPLFANHPASEQCAIRACVASALFNKRGSCIGSLVVGYHEPREHIASQQTALLQRINKVAAQLLERFHLVNRHRVLSQVMRSVYTPVVVCDSNNRVEFANWAACDLFDDGTTPLHGRPLAALFEHSPDAASPEFQAWLNTPQDTTSGSMVLRNIRLQQPGGKIRVMESQHSLWRLGAITGSSLVMRDITETYSQQKRLREVAMTDSLTGLPNRLAALEQIDIVSKRDKQALVLAIIDIHNFKSLNDTLGHNTGDIFLQLISSRLQSESPLGATLARIGGDEFMLVAPNIEEREAEILLQRMLIAIARPSHIDGHLIQADGRAGYVVAEAEADCSSSDLLARADLALYRARANNMHQPCKFDISMRQDAIEHRRMDLELRRAYANDEFELHYQPQIDLASGELIGAEALLRWRHPERGLLAPLHFIDALTNSPIASSVGSWVIEQGCRDAMQWPLINGRPITVSINLFPSQIFDGSLQTAVCDALAKTGLPAERLELEITEFIALNPNDEATGVFNRINRLGVRLAFDDFGTGYASLSVLQRFPIDRIKIDRSFVRDMLENPGDAAIVQSIATISRNLQMDVVAEGVENDLQAHQLQLYGCSSAQGYLYAPPLGPDAFVTWVNRMIDKPGNPQA